MALMAWSPTFSVKVKQFDDQHIKLVNMVNELHDAMREGKGKEILGKILNDLITYTATHFKDEEKLLAQHSYPELSQHKAIHETLVKQVLELQAKFKSGQAILTLDVMTFLKDWLVKHIQGDDKKYGVYLNGKGVV
jgi:hemerythrin